MEQGIKAALRNKCFDCGSPPHRELCGQGGPPAHCAPYTKMRNEQRDSVPFVSKRRLGAGPPAAVFTLPCSCHCRRREGGALSPETASAGRGTTDTSALVALRMRCVQGKALPPWPIKSSYLTPLSLPVGLSHPRSARSPANAADSMILSRTLVRCQRFAK